MTFFPRVGLMRVVEGGALVASDAILTGDITLGEDASIWFGCVVRGDDAPLAVGARTNIQDLSMVHADTGRPNVIGADVTVGHGVILHGVEVGDGCLIGMGAVLLGGSRVGEQAIVAAGAVVKEHFRVPPRTLVAGVPAKIIRELQPKEIEMIQGSAAAYVEKARLYLADSEPV